MPNDMDGELSFILTDYVYCQTNHIGGVMVIVLSSSAVHRGAGAGGGQLL